MNASWGFRFYFWIIFVVIIEADQINRNSGVICSNPLHVACGSGQRLCIHPTWQCDGEDDCDDGSDERNCGNLNSAKSCLSSQFACEYDKHCIPGTWQCDGTDDCSDGSDERNCASRCDPTFKPSRDPGAEWISLDDVEKNPYGTKRQLKCSEGYEKVGYPEIVECQPDGTWTKTNATCKEILCDPTFKPSISPGSEWISLENAEKNNSFGAKRQLKCSKGYEKVGCPEIVLCQQDGSWTRTDATCREILCDLTFKPSISPGGEWTSLDDVEKNNSYGARRLIKCSKGYEKVGYPEIVQCQLDGSWTRTNATCREILCDLAFKPSISPGGEWIPLDDVEKNNSYGARRQIKCSKGYEKVGYPEVVQCHLDGSWTRTNATCREDKLINAGNAALKGNTFNVIIVVIVILVLIILALIGTAIYFARKLRYRKEVVVVYKNPPSVGSGEDFESGHYETIRDNTAAKLVPQMLTDASILGTTSQKSPVTSADAAFNLLKNCQPYKQT